MSLFVFGSVAAMGVAVAWALYGDKIRVLIVGSGKRRFTPASAAAAADTIRTLEMQLAAEKRRSCVNCGHLKGWPTGAELADSDRSDPAPHISAKAPVDNGSRDTPAAAAATVRDASLTEMALPGEEEMAAFLEGERAKNAAAREADTVTLPAVVTVKPLQQAQADLEALVHATPPPAGASATEVSAITGDRAVRSVAVSLGSKT